MKFEDFLKNSAIFITLTTAFFYCCSSFYVNGYFRVLGLDSDVLERNFHSIVFDGFTLSLNKSVTIFYLLVVTFWLRAIFISEVSRITKNDSNLKKCIRFKRKIYKRLNFKGKYSSWPSWPYLAPAFRALMFFVSFVVIVLGLKSFQADGMNNAMYIKNHIVEEFSEKQKPITSATKEHPFNMVTSLKAELNQPLYLLYCGSRMCAGFDLESEEVVYFPQTGYRLKRGLASFQ
ncbi:hypothetical protein KO533_21815 [Shewanella sp. NKUCC05_KAH]|uniref:hypothetical protein n=1 Tax=Shewanella sp. NKUCC05_KAH TaxID=2842126 RepID=UPI001C5B2629|nr:hypothetical protein [Shewanella sp. NKUCC05_KAH]MBW3529182.1 hypothetical protein [Shewanella sp. NKUCC05_KAH]